MRLSTCHQSKIIRHPVNHQLQCLSCGQIQGSKTKTLDIPEVQKTQKDPFFAQMDKIPKEKKKRILSGAQIYMINKRKEEQEWEMRKKLRKEKYFNSLKHMSPNESD